MTEEIQIPFPEAEQQQHDKSIREQFLELEAREKRDAEAALNAKLDGIAESNDASDLKSDLSLRVKFVERHGWKTFAVLNQRHAQRISAAEHTEKIANRESRLAQISTPQTRLAALNKARKAAQ